MSDLVEYFVTSLLSIFEATVDEFSLLSQF